MNDKNKFITRMNKEDLTGKTFGKLLVLRACEHGWECKCECGKIKVVSYYKLISGHTKSCGSYIHRRKHDITGQRFGRLVAIRPFEGKTKRAGKWIFMCDCGKEAVLSISDVMRSGTKSCGCWKQEKNEKNISDSRLYRIWQGMKSRCYNKHAKKYARYGGRGIQICKEWMDFEVFMDWAYNNGYRDNLTIERIDINKDYCPNNCTWITLEKQANNRCTSVRITYNGQNMTLKDLSDYLNLPYISIHYHYKNGNLEKWLKKKGF